MHSTLSWNCSQAPISFTLALDGVEIARDIIAIYYTLNRTAVKSGKHIVTVIAEGAVNYYPLADERIDVRLKVARPVRVHTSFELKRNDS